MLNHLALLSSYASGLHAKFEHSNSVPPLALAGGQKAGFLTCYSTLPSEEACATCSARDAAATERDGVRPVEDRRR